MNRPLANLYTSENYARPFGLEYDGNGVRKYPMSTKDYMIRKYIT